MSVFAHPCSSSFTRPAVESEQEIEADAKSSFGGEKISGDSELDDISVDPSRTLE